MQDEEVYLQAFIRELDMDIREKEIKRDRLRKILGKLQRQEIEQQPTKQTPTQGGFL